MFFHIAYPQSIIFNSTCVAYQIKKTSYMRKFIAKLFIVNVFLAHKVIIFIGGKPNVIQWPQLMLLGDSVR